MAITAWMVDFAERVPYLLVLSLLVLFVCGPCYLYRQTGQVSSFS